MTEQVNFTLSLLAASVMQQNQMLKQQNAMQRELLDQVDAVGDRLWRMEHRIAALPVDQGQAAKKRHLARMKATSRKHGGKKA